MKLLVIRHAVAMDRDEFAESGESDDLRPLTDDGAREMKRVAKGLRAEIGNIDVLVTSPLRRAMQTARIVGKAYRMKVSRTTDALLPDANPDELEKLCAEIGVKDTIAVVGHEPHLSHLVTWLMVGGRDSRIRMRKGGACLLEFESLPRRESGTLGWLLTRGQLRRLGR